MQLNLNEGDHDDKGKEQNFCVVICYVFENIYRNMYKMYEEKESRAVVSHNVVAQALGSDDF